VVSRYVKIFAEESGEVNRKQIKIKTKKGETRASARKPRKKKLGRERVCRGGQADQIGRMGKGVKGVKKRSKRAGSKSGGGGSSELARGVKGSGAGERKKAGPEVGEKEEDASQKKRRRNGRKSGK